MAGAEKGTTSSSSSSSSTETSEQRFLNAELLKICENGRAPDVNRLLDLGADTETRRSSDGATPIMIALANGKPTLVEALLRRGADPAEALDYTFEHRWAFPLEKMLDLAPGVLKGKGELEFIHLAAARLGGTQAIKVVDLLLKRGADVNMMDPRWGRTPTHYAVAAFVDDKADLVEFLVQNGAAVEQQDSQGETPLALASRRRHAKTIYMLLEKFNASVDPRASYGCTPLASIALSSVYPGKDRATGMLLFAYGADPHADVPDHYPYPSIDAALADNWKSASPWSPGPLYEVCSTHKMIRLEGFECCRRFLHWALTSPSVAVAQEEGKLPPPRPVKTIEKAVEVKAHRLKEIREDAWARRRHLAFARYAFRNGGRREKKVKKDESSSAAGSGSA
jgi:Ankyrin repeats (3 copies)/Ankyrin repeat